SPAACATTGGRPGNSSGNGQAGVGAAPHLQRGQPIRSRTLADMMSVHAYIPAQLRHLAAERALDHPRIDCYALYELAHRPRSPWPVCHRGSLTAQGGLLVDTTCIGDGDRRWTVAAPPLAAAHGMLLTCARAAVRSHAGVPQVCASASEHPLFLGG